MFKKAICFSCFFLLLMPIFLFAQAQWSSPITLGQGLLPDFSIDQKTGHLHIVYHVANQGVMYIETDSDGAIIVGPELVPHTDGDGNLELIDDGNAGWDFGASIAVDSNGYPNICYRVPRADNYFDLKYIRKTIQGWSNPLFLSSNIRRGYVVRMAIDGQDRVHIGQSKAGDNIWGHIKYFRVENGVKQKDFQLTEDARQEYRADNRFEVDATENGEVHFIIGCPGIEGDATIAPITYYRSLDGGDTFQRIADIHHRTDCIHRNAAPDVSIDKNESIHFVYGARYDNSISGSPSMRYVKYENNTIILDKAITTNGELQHWNHKDYGLGSIATSYDGGYLVCAYLNFNSGDLFVRRSDDGGESWSDSEELASGIGGAEGRNMHLIRSYNNNFYVIYPENGSKPYVKMRFLRHVGDLAPVANAGGPYSISEGDSLTLDGSETKDFGQNTGIALYEWDYNGDGIYDISTDQPLTKLYFDNNFEAKAILKVTDQVGNTDTSHANIVVHNIAPSVTIGSNRSINEGEIVTVNSIVTDPGNDVFSYSWILGDGSTYTSDTISHLFPDNGLYHITLYVSDGDGGTAQDAISVLIANVNPTATIEETYEASINTPIIFTGSAFDPGPNDQNNLIYAWDLDNDGNYEASGLTATHSYDTTGSYIIWFKVMDDDGGKDSTSATVTVTNLPPSIDAIADQVIREGETFPSINLDQYVIDSDQLADQLLWSIQSGHVLTFTLQNRTLNIMTPSADWFGRDSLWVKVTDPGQLEDSTQIHFIVQPVNDAPQWSSVPDFSFNEDDTLHLDFTTLYEFVNDIDNVSEDFTFSFTKSGDLDWKLNNEKDRFDFIPKANWNGQQEVIFTVRDSENAMATDTSLFTIRPVNDAPNEFSIIDPLYLEYDAWPDSIIFSWQQPTDPDEGDQISYEWTLKRQGSLETISRTEKTLELQYTFYPDSELEEGTYFWWINAIDQTEMTRRSSREGIVIVGDPTQVNVDLTQLPLKFDLLPSFPNPFNPETTITYHLPVPSLVQLDIYNLIGQKVNTLVNHKEAAGVYLLRWDGTNFSGNQVPSGIYFIQLITGQERFLQKNIFGKVKTKGSANVID